MNVYRPAPVRFEKYVERIAGVNCWIWMGAVDADGYGVFGDELTPSGRNPGIKAHRFAYRQKHGDIPPGMLVCHHCDVPSCVNPDHLFVGTNADNMRDKTLKGRHSNGWPRKR